uniref:Uncharacterized protein n=1 Tax=Arion vulgaris TaxID=1028688 RepID=A0A0B6Y729_9EUPU
MLCLPVLETTSKRRMKLRKRNEGYKPGHKNINKLSRNKHTSYKNTSFASVRIKILPAGTNLQNKVVVDRLRPQANLPVYDPYWNN